MSCPVLLANVILFGLFISVLQAKAVPPSIVVQPENQIVGSGVAARFSVMADGDLPLNYQWRFDGENLINATNASLILSNVQPTQAGNYSVVVSSSNGTNVSNDAVLEVCWEVQLGTLERIPPPTNAPFAWWPKFDAQGNLYVSPYIEGRIGFSLVKLTPNHEQAWEIQAIAEPGVRYSNLADFAIDSTGNVYIVGVAATNFHTDREQIITWKYDREGVQVWSDRHESAGFPHGIAVDATGNVLVVATTSEGFNSNGGSKPPGNIELTKFSPAGQRLWTVIYDGPGHDTRDLGPVATDAIGNVYFALTAYQTGASWYNQEVVLAKYDGAGIKQWTARRPGFQVYAPNSLLVDQAGNAVVGLSFWHGAPFDTHGTVKFDTNGHLLWDIGHLEYSEINMTGTRTLDQFNNVYFAMIRDYDHKLIVTKYDPEGKVLWSVEHDSTEHWFFYQSGALYIAPDQRVTFAGFGGGWDPSTLNFATFHQNTRENRPIIHGEQARARRVASVTTVPFDVNATGLPPLHYLWRRDGADLAGATNATLVLTNVTASDSGRYSVLVTNAAGCSVSNEGLLVVVNVPPFQMEQVRVTSDYLTFTLTGELGRLYWIEVSTNLVDWTDVIGYGGGPMSVRKSGFPWRFVRARTDP